ncbi:hypothetical protein B0T18DRAFT_392541 [Schizothecium vesticola]|uniref:Nephrocystin 3-like N-terminal domain-containing protein n=1 Tax=Schizothecium vesticola TaxID=314040 RepID=A0AA40K2T4_9PEZI|nr:hypothetical protein B0T18DRAFT_392541 [Schizothecium vesticola]
MEADIQQYPAHETRGRLLLGSAYGLHAITIIVFLIRLYSRLTPRFALTAADYTITIAVSRIYTISLDEICKGIDFLKLGIPTKPSAPSDDVEIPSRAEIVTLVNSLASALSQEEARVAEWLKSGDGAFWITGKAGSGKSTLMKFIADHPGTVRLAAEFASPKRAFIAAHYVWGPGMSMQRSIQGLLQSLLYDIFRQYPVGYPDSLSGALESGSQREQKVCVDAYRAQVCSL